jgi:glutamate racemase
MTKVSSPAPIGIYDSGVGGLSVLQALVKSLPREQFIYVADSGNAPYGDKSASFIEQRALHIATFMQQQRVKAFVVACNTASVVAAKSLRQAVTFPVIAMEPAIKPAVAQTRSGAVLVMGTNATISSPAVAELCRRFGQQSRILLKGCPGLVELVEQGLVDAEKTYQLVESYLRPALRQGADTIVIGCTHFSFLLDTITRIAGPRVSIIEPSAAIAAQLSRVLACGPGFASEEQDSGPLYFTSGLVPSLESFLDRTVGTRPDVHALPSTQL